MFQSAVGIVAVVFLMIGAGFLFEMKGWFGENAGTVLSRIALRIGIPALIFSNFLTNYTRKELISSAPALLVPLAVIGGMYLLSGPLTKWLRIQTARRGVFRALFSYGNSVFIAMPVCRALFGEAAVPGVLLYYLVNTLHWWTIGAPGVARDGGVTVRGLWGRLASPPLVACLVSLALVLLGIRPPALALTLAGYLAGMVTPLSMLFIGCTLYGMVKSGVRWEKGYGAVLAGRCLLGPLMSLPLCLLLGLPDPLLGVFFVQSGMPAQTQCSLWAQEHGADARYAAGCTALSTLAGLAAIPVYAWVLETFL